MSLKVLTFTLILPVLMASRTLGVESHRIVVEFSPNDFLTEPQVLDNEFTLILASGNVHVPELDPTLHMESLYRRGSPSYSFKGPWVIFLPGTEVSGMSSEIADLEVSSYIEDAYDSSEQILNPVLGEISLAAFPPHDTSVQNQYFCDTDNPQHHFHYRLENEPPQPGDWCQEYRTDSTLDSDMDCVQAWGITRGDSNVVVAVADLGIDWTHLALGGPGPLVSGSLMDSLCSYNNGVVFRNWLEQPGDGNDDGMPGIAGIDDDDNGLIDEDSMDREPWNISELDLIFGTATSVGINTIVDLNAQFGNLSGLFLTANVNEFNQVSAKISSNNATTITTLPLNPLTYPNGWADIASPGDLYRISDRADTDNDGEIDDTGYLADLVADDDENSYNDDLRGWDFVNLTVPFNPDFHFDKGDYWEGDNDPRDLGNHGTEVASQVASSWEYGEIVGVAPGVKLLPIRVGYYKKPYVETLDSVALARGIDYARTMGVKILVTALREPFGCESSFNSAISENDIVHVNGAGNLPQMTNNWVGVTEPNILVAGLYAGDSGWAYTSYGEWVDVSARAVSVVAAAPNHLTSGTPGYNWLDGTSLSGPMVGGVAALIRSVYPSWSRDEIISKIVNSTDNIYMPPEEPALNTYFYADGGKWLGSGRANAYRAITFFGSIPAVSNPDTAWSGTVYVSGDITIPAGKRLTLQAGTIVKVALNDILESNSSNPDTASLRNVQFHVAGEFICNGTAEEPVVFELHKAANDTTSSWGPIILEGGSVGCLASFAYTEFRDLRGGIVKAYPARDNRVDLSMTNCTLLSNPKWIPDNIGRPYSGVVIHGLQGGDIIDIANTEIVREGSYGYEGLDIRAVSGRTDYSINIGPGTIIDGFESGFILLNAESGVFSGIQVVNAGIGITVIGGNVGPAIGPDVSVGASTSIGVLHSGGTVTYDGVTIGNSGETGLHVDNGGLPVFGVNGVGISNSGLHGAHFEEIDDSASIGNLNIDGSADTGIRITGCSPTLSGSNTISGPGSAGVFLVGSNSNVSGVQIDGVGSGVRVFDFSDPDVRECHIFNCTYGVFVGLDGMGDFGSQANYGLNVFDNISISYGVNWNPSYELPFLYNCYDGLPDALPSKFGVKKPPAGITNGVILFSPGYCQ